MANEHTTRIVRAIESTRNQMSSGSRSLGWLVSLQVLWHELIRPFECTTHLPIIPPDLFGAGSKLDLTLAAADGIDLPDGGEGRKWGHRYGYPGYASAEELLSRIAQANWQPYCSLNKGFRRWVAFKTPDLPGWSDRFITLDELLQTELADSLYLLCDERKGTTECTVYGVIDGSMSVDCSTIILTSPRLWRNSAEVLYELYPGLTCPRAKARYKQGIVRLSVELQARVPKNDRCKPCIIPVDNREARELGFNCALVNG